MHYLLLIVGFILLIKGADLFVEGSSSIAKMLKIPSMIVGLTIVAMGTSAPEAAVSISATMSGSNDMAVGNIVGSCILNLMLIAGICAVVKPISVDKSILKSDFPVSILAAVLLLIVCIGNNLIVTRIEGIIIFLLFAAYIVFTVVRALRYRKNAVNTDEIRTLSLPKTIIFTILGAAAIVCGGQMTVESAKSIASSLGVSEHLIRKGESDMALGNVIGSNIFNILFILGMTAAIKPVKVDIFSVYDSAVLVGMSIMVFIFAFTRKRLGRLEGSLMLLTYSVYTGYIIVR